MAFITTGLTNGGVTAHYRFSYDQALAAPGGPEPARTNAVIAACEHDYNLMHAWFGGNVNVTGLTVQVTTDSGGASWEGSPTGATVTLKGQGESYSNNPAYLRYLLVAEVVEIFMLAQNAGWFGTHTEGSKGEGLSRFLSGQLLVQGGFLGLGIDANYALADRWLNSARQDYVNNAPEDNGANEINGCTTLFIYYLFHQLGFSINQIVAAASPTLAAVYRKLTGDHGDPFPRFKQLLDARFPSHTSSAVPGPNFDDPWPLGSGSVAYSGVWRSGSDAHALWLNASQDSFVAKWNQLAAQNLRLVDFDMATVNNQRLWSGVWRSGSDAHALWLNASQDSFVAKWTQLAAQNLRLIRIRTYDGLWAGTWRAGSDAHALWLNASQDSFLAKHNELTAHNLRLVDFTVATVNGERRWSGVWRAGTDAYALWINFSWNAFVAKWNELSAQNLRLVSIRTYDGLWAGAWRSGTDAHALWANTDQDSFVAKWNQFSAQNLRLVDLVTVPATAGGSAISVELHGTSTGLGGEHFQPLVGAGVTAKRLDLRDAQHGEAAEPAESGGNLPATGPAPVVGNGNGDGGSSLSPVGVTHAATDGDGGSSLSLVGQTHATTDGTGEADGLSPQGGRRGRSGRGIHARKPGA